MINIVWGSYNFARGVVLMTEGTAADVTGVGALLGLPANFVGALTAFTGGAKAFKGSKQYVQGSLQGDYDQTPLKFGGHVVYGLLPAGKSIEDIVGGF